MTQSRSEDQLKRWNEQAATVATPMSIWIGDRWAAPAREQGNTIDVAYRYFATPKHKFIIAGTPGISIHAT
jgi:sulfate adenylyltransferase subunit 1 (EFTu-like GTPase family)